MNIYNNVNNNLKTSPIQLPTVNKSQLDKIKFNRCTKALQEQAAIAPNLRSWNKVKPILNEALHLAPATSLFNNFKSNTKKLINESNETQIAELLDLVADNDKSKKYLLQILSAEQVEAAAQTRMPESTSIKTVIKSMAKEPVKVETEELSPIKVKLKFINSKVQIILHHFSDLFEKLINPFQTHKHVQSHQEAYSILRSYVEFFSIPILIGSLLGTVIPIATPILIVVFIIVMIGIVGIYFKFLKAPPHDLPPFRNLTDEAKAGKIQPQPGRDNELREIVEILGDLKHVSMHPIIVGPCGIGKTRMMMKLAYEMSNGSIPALKGKQVFYAHASCLTEKNDLESVFDQNKSHEDNTIYVIDGIETLSEPKNKHTLDILKAHMDTNPRKIHVIGLTTPKEYNKSLTSEPLFANQFQVVKLGPTAKQDTIDILRQFANTNAPDIHVTNESLKKIVELTNVIKTDEYQPARAISLLVKALSLAQKHQTGHDKILDSLKHDYKLLQNTFHRSKKYRIDTPAGKEAAKLRRALRKEIHKRESNIADEKQQLLKFREAQTEKKNLKASLWKQASVLSKKHSNDALKNFIFDMYFDLPQKTQELKKCKGEFVHLNSGVDLTLVNNVYKDWVKQHKKKAVKVDAKPLEK
ncbi:MAG: ATP-dependent Clp protease ATP-binding subunit, partial [Parachlamydiales bacterium]|nr:ATP-dependent Clp protease ATP-binding subunit [Parachlamydiales bacterium]